LISKEIGISDLGDITSVPPSTKDYFYYLTGLNAVPGVLCV